MSSSSLTSGAMVVRFMAAAWREDECGGGAGAGGAARDAIDTNTEAGSRNKRTSATRHADRSVFSLMVHGPEFGSELVINPDCFPDVKVNDLLEIAQPDREHQRLVLQVTSLAPVKGKLQVSVLKDIATQFGLDVFYNVVVVQRVDPREVALDFLELSM
ncbi:hypothetical protein ATCC90586_010518 [Pythium insidiosum]|nr:hypothetical protein ATCC90586_010518 [Pythium insidiosum]